MSIILTDLDGTLIFSSRKLGKYTYEKSELICADKVFQKEKSYSYIHEKSLENLKNSKYKIIPTTTRSIDEYTRLENVLIDNFDYAIVSNGGNILYKNKPLKEYSKLIEEIKSTINYSVIKDYLEKTIENIELKLIDNTYFKFQKELTSADKITLNNLEKLYPNWVISYQFGKVFIVPKNITKENAVSFLLNYLKLPNEIAHSFGDTNLDLGILELANKALVPIHSDVKKLLDTGEYSIDYDVYYLNPFEKVKSLV